MRHHSGQNVDSRGAAECVYNKEFNFATVLTHTVVYKSIYHATPRSSCFLSQYQRRRKRFFFRF